MARQIVVAFVLLTGDWQSLLITPPKTVLKLFFFPFPAHWALSGGCFDALRCRMASTAFELHGSRFNWPYNRRHLHNAAWHYGRAFARAIPTAPKSSITGRG
jgi:hypothetical protein